MKKSLRIFIIIFAVSFSSCQVSRFVYYNFPNSTDYKIFPSRTIRHGGPVFTFALTEHGKFPKTLNSTRGKKEKEMPFDEFLADHKSLAFLIIHNDTLQYEKYFSGYDQSNLVPSFSVAKSVQSILIGCAIDDGLIGSVEDPIVNYISELKANGLEKVKIRHLLQMTSGIQFNESYINPFGDAAAFYYGRNLRKHIARMKPGAEPGTEFHYVSGGTQLLGLVLERSLKGKP